MTSRCSGTALAKKRFNEAPPAKGGKSPRRHKRIDTMKAASMRPPQRRGGNERGEVVPPLEVMGFNEAPPAKGGK